MLTGTGAVFRTAQVAPGASVAVIGAGGIGLAAVQGARIAGAGRSSSSTSAVESWRSRSRSAPPTTVDARRVDDVVGGRDDLTGGGVDYSFEAIGTKVTAEQAFRMLDAGGHGDDHRHGAEQRNRSSSAAWTC